MSNEKVVRRCSNCGDEWVAKKNAIGNHYDCFACGCSGEYIETIRGVDAESDHSSG